MTDARGEIYKGKQEETQKVAKHHNEKKNI